ncbi:MAG: DNA-formamidopyrimidine glycosylase [Patescibacteria group bacterium]
MPELPEVETVRRGLSQLIVGKAVRAIEHDWEKSFPNALSDVNKFLVDAKIIDIRRRAKVLLIDLSTEYTLVIHLKMTGQMVYVRKLELSVISNQFSAKTENRIQATDNIALPERFGAGHPNASLVGELPDKSTRVTFTFSDGSHLYFNDQRKFGWVKLFPTAEVPNVDFMRKLGSEPLAADFTVQHFRECLMRRPNTNIKAALLDQTVIAGVGNIYADESLWGAKIHPSTLVKNLPEVKFNKLYEELRYVLNLAIEKGGSTDRNYVNAEGKKGSYLTFARVFRRENQPCPRCATTILKTRVAGRGTHICPHCQKLGKISR